MNEWFRKTFSYDELPWTFTWFYGVGLALFIFPFTRDLFIFLIPLSLLLVIGAVFSYHREWDIKTVGLFAFIYFSSFFLEMAGVNTGMIFGPYIYDRALGLQINGTPLIIGLNWLFLVYSSHDITARYIRQPVLIIIGGSVLMIIYDLIMEWVAPSMQMWHFNDGYPSVSNFLAWFLTAFVYHTLFAVFNIDTENRPARTLFASQIVFFILIGLISLII